MASSRSPQKMTLLLSVTTILTHCMRLAWDWCYRVRIWNSDSYLVCLVNPWTLNFTQMTNVFLLENLCKFNLERILSSYLLDFHCKCRTLFIFYVVFLLLFFFKFENQWKSQIHFLWQTTAGHRCISQILEMLLTRCLEEMESNVLDRVGTLPNLN